MLERGNNHFSFFSGVIKLIVYYRSQIVTNKICKVCANGGRTERARYELLLATREHMEIRCWRSRRSRRG